MIHVPDHIINFKDEKTRSEFRQVKPRLQAFILAAGSFMYFTYGITLVVTDLLRSNKASVHNYGDGVDWRTHDPETGAEMLTQEQGDALVKHLKWQFPYYLKLPMPTSPKYSIKDERKPHSSKNWTGPHIHGQVNWREA